jgi:hypothetical protein
MNIRYQYKFFRWDLSADLAGLWGDQKKQEEMRVFEKFVNAQSEDGWEFVSMSGGGFSSSYVLLRRPLP